MDALTEVINALHLQSSVYCRSELGFDGWGIQFEATTCATFHYLEDGDAWLSVADARYHLCAGDFVVLPHGTPHRITHHHTGKTPTTLIQLDRDVPEVCAIKRFGTENPLAILICGTFDFNHQNQHPFFSLLPPVIHLHPASHTLPAILQLISHEAAHPQNGAPLMLKRLADALFVQFIRAWLATTDHAANGWLGALRDPQIGQALALIHHQPENAWTIATLAQAVAMSRSAFAARFTDLVGETPMHYLTRWRIHCAARALKSDQRTMSDIALSVGYGSEAAFSKAFKREMGYAPGVYRRMSN